MHTCMQCLMMFRNIQQLLYLYFHVIITGFDDQDMIRPSFTEPALGPSIPFILSKPGVVPVIQVSIIMRKYYIQLSQILKSIC